MKRVLITGATGFVGCRLAEALIEQGVPVTALVRTWSNAARLARLPVAMVGGDMLDLDSVRSAVKGCDVVIHCAVDNRAYDTGRAQEHRRSSELGTANVLQAALEGRVERVVHLSSVAVYGYEAYPEAATETASYRYTGDAYCDGKIDAECVALRYHQQHGLPVAVLRPTLVYGPFNYWSAMLVSAIRRGRMALLDGGTGICNSLYVDNLVDAILIAAVHPQAPGQVYHISDAAPVSWREFLEGHARAIGDDWLPLPDFSSEEFRRARAERNPELRPRHPLVAQALAHPVIGPLARLAKASARCLVPVGVRRRFRQALTPTASPAAGPAPVRPISDFEIPTTFLWKVTFRIDKAVSALGYQPKIDFATGMERTAAWLRWARV
jgi:nucleoside-diphosphate-sugar epimerase